MRGLQLRLWVWLQLTVERTEKHEADVEHVANELLLELPHFCEQLPHVVAAIVH